MRGRLMRWLVTAGGTLALIDKVRAISNGATGRTGARIAAEARRRGHPVTLLTSNPDAVREMIGEALPSGPEWDVRPYRTFDDLRAQLAREIRSGDFDCVVHSAAVSDYRVAGVYGLAAGT